MVLVWAVLIKLDCFAFFDTNLVLGLLIESYLIHHIAKHEQ